MSKSESRKITDNCLSIVVPCYNEEEMLPTTVDVLTGLIDEMISDGRVSERSFVLFVNDGSKDRTLPMLREFAKNRSHVCFVTLSANRGHQSALIAGLMEAKKYADMMISIDADLQDDVNVIPDMVDKYLNGADIVYGVRSGRKSDSFFKRTTAQMFYKLLALMGVKTVYNHADFRLMSRRAVEALSEYREKNLYIRGIIPQLGFITDEVSYERKARTAGESKYPLRKMLALALNGITSFSTKPLQMITSIGIIVLVTCFIAAVYAFVSYFTNDVERGWTSLILSIWFLGGVQLLSLGVIGEYIGKIYAEVKNRPLYFIEDSDMSSADGTDRD
ncbi:MAG: glycosyltransferase family 2 protein [Lachnospiraceae bacterium]|jgi:glycosyltransferase involved in cell wall biosynthesis|nr:glycosyltransferase family 2 protein [Lachnospiraceae bacterium]